MKVNPDMDRLLVKCLLQEATAAEREQVADWSAADRDNEQYFEDFRRIWEDCGRLAPGRASGEGLGARGGEGDEEGAKGAEGAVDDEGATGAGRVVDEEGAWERFRAGGSLRTRRGGGIEGWAAGAKGGGKVFILHTLRPVAVAVILFLAGGVAWWVVSGRAGGGSELLSLQTKALARTDTLPDGSLATLNKNSSLEFARQFGGHSRVVYLKGEGFFQVVHRVRQPFIVKMNGVTIRDLGTSFDVRARNGEANVIVIVEAGEVQVESGPYVVKAGAGEKVVVGGNRTGPGQTADGLYPRKTAAADELYQYYRTKQFVCRSTPLWKLTEVLNEAYDVHIVIEGRALRDLPLTATFRNESLDSVLDVVTRTFGLTLSRNGQEIMLKQ